MTGSKIERREIKCLLTKISCVFWFILEYIRTALKNFGHVLGLLTLSRNKSLPHKVLPLKDMILAAYEKGYLTAVIPMVCKVRGYGGHV
jgi:hypothetical protein